MKQRLEDFWIWCVGLLGASVLWLLYRSLRWTNLGALEQKNFLEDKAPAVFAFWHSRQLMAPWMLLEFRGKSRVPCYTLISQHRDGRIVARIIKFLGLGSVAGSSSRGGARALKEMIGLLEKGAFVGVTPDGPRGPMQKAKIGVVKLAQTSGLPIYYGAYAAERQWVFGSWDRMILPKPFSRAVRIGAGPFWLPKDLADEDLPIWAEKLEQALNEVTEKADRYFHATPTL